MEDFINTVVMAIITGIIAGFISSVLVTRLARFEELRSESQRILRSLEYMKADDGGTEIINNKPDVSTLTHIAGDLYALGHKNAGETISALVSEIITTIANPPEYEKTVEKDKRWQSMGRELKPSMRSILKLRLGI